MGVFPHAFCAAYTHWLLQGTICHEAGLAVGELSGHDAFFKFSDELFATAKVSEHRSDHAARHTTGPVLCGMPPI